MVDIENKTIKEIKELLDDLYSKNQYYKNEWEQTAILIKAKNKELTSLKKENAKLKQEIYNIKEESNNLKLF